MKEINGFEVNKGIEVRWQEKLWWNQLAQFHSHIE